MLLLREWLAALYQRGTDGGDASAANWRRSAGFFRFMLREGVVPINVARLVRTPKAPKKLPEVMTAEQANTLLDGVAAGQTGAAASGARPRHLRAALRLRDARQRTGRDEPGGSRPRAKAGCGCAARARRNGRCRCRGKAARGAGALSRRAAGGARGARGVSESPRRAADDARHQRHRQAVRDAIWRATRRCIRTASGMPTRRTCWPTARTCARFRNCWGTRASPPRRSTRRSR